MKATRKLSQVVFLLLGLLGTTIVPLATHADGDILGKFTLASEALLGFQIFIIVTLIFRVIPRGRPVLIHRLARRPQQFVSWTCASGGSAAAMPGRPVLRRIPDHAARFLWRVPPTFGFR